MEDLKNKIIEYLIKKLDRGYIDDPDVELIEIIMK